MKDRIYIMTDWSLFNLVKELRPIEVPI